MAAEREGRMAERQQRKVVGLGLWRNLLFVALLLLAVQSAIGGEEKRHFRNAYAAMMYMGTPRDYEFYVALRVMLRSLVRLKVQADLVVIASLDVPRRWIEAM